MSRSMIAVARKHRAEQERDNVTFTLADLEALPFVEHSFDFVVAASSVQRTNLEVSVPELRRMVKPGGRLALYVNVSSFPRLRDWRPIRIVGSIRAAAGYLSAHGFRTTWRLMRFQTSSAWIHQGDQVEYVRARGGQARDRALVSARPVPTPDALREICTRLLPGCSIERTNKWAVMVTWDSPSADGEDAAGCLTVGGGAAGCRSRVG
jgi:SAM-dependent methyltransferase